MCVYTQVFPSLQFCCFFPVLISHCTIGVLSWWIPCVYILILLFVVCCRKISALRKPILWLSKSSVSRARVRIYCLFSGIGFQARKVGTEICKQCFDWSFFVRENSYCSVLELAQNYRRNELVGETTSTCWQPLGFP